MVALAKKHRYYMCHKLAYELEREAKVFIGKAKVAEILLKHGLREEFGLRPPQEKDIPADMLLHEPYRKNLL